MIACGGRPAGDLAAFVERLQADGWTVCVIATPSATKFIDAERLSALTGYPVRHDYKRPEEPDVLPPADAMAVVPATFNTTNKWAQGISDTLALGLLTEPSVSACRSPSPGPTTPSRNIPPSPTAWPGLRNGAYG
ncbi:flavoprotein [Microbispora sp. H10830]|uniref:flavoprotein n=1 Tax=Microbispora sp. H10830 TaxID=2729109 RepID=UPI002873793E|nr:flavoprotein [Microbispora sp. H10830]